MPKLEPKEIQKELEKRQVWPVYWLYGSESMKSRELLKRIARAVLPPDDSDAGDASAAETQGPGALFARNLFAVDQLDGSEVSAEQILDAAQGLALGGGTKLIVVKNAHAVKESELLEPLLGSAQKVSALSSVCVFLSKDLDGRKKFSKLLVERAAVVPCEEVGEDEREAWIAYLAKRRGQTLDPAWVASLRSMDPWSLDCVERELEKIELLQSASDSAAATALISQVLPNRGSGEGGADLFIDAFFSREHAAALTAVESFAEHPEEALPLLGLMNWNLRYLGWVLADREQGTRTAKLNPYSAEKLNRWSRLWRLPEIPRLQNALARVDAGMKSARNPKGLWVDLVNEFAH